MDRMCDFLYPKRSLCLVEEQETPQKKPRYTKSCFNGINTAPIYYQWIIIGGWSNLERITENSISPTHET